MDRLFFTPVASIGKYAKRDGGLPWLGSRGSLFPPPHHGTQQGNRRGPVVFSDKDYRTSLRLIAEAAAKAGMAVWAYCLMPNHVHLIFVPSRPDGLRAVLGDAHRRNTARINQCFPWTGRLFQGRFGSVVMDEDHLVAAIRYVAVNPVRAGLVVYHTMLTPFDQEQP